MSIRKACEHDLSRIAEIFVLNNRINYFPIFQDEEFSFGKLQVISVADTYFKRPDILSQIYVYDDGLIRGFFQMDGSEICKLYVDPFFQSRGIGGSLIEYGIRAFGADHLWALEKNTRALSFYQKHGFMLTGEKKFEEGTTEYLVQLKREN